ncbi:TPA: flagellar biosynthesis anti-sigma factor FlgM [Vibrio parahaemolyticus]|uniref:flagellar biosynthesis anti-sigma factor FlgM n=1 Tax=Vibrio parahaemolyticus TaxID=670 RepID=UPI001120C1C6|nr:flagellar biosynthesis anti-sigma factor FlgM [Vibrio parahaemolyticus]EGQ9465731.1 flagellar biosynthesis anti-sigma factor FlgM [Vibrio parahaemolyticus]EJA7340919.1 flagellar biosynthesis anti-sigma factor FlgM [Vibrio parahaemolyticus]EJB0383437.1 flagellar biosynthesis anti-sigma factor FlgM [Vibrio parahaemolyticus]EJG1103476.1 flagellar biosynthesis anti-sigma factor FlgM [Vibrio parahaemolyticus]ELA6666260.1 flagellar biosynthesis anti-sigma factor FlgM [Vibrio parahaemolyticus]
MKIDKVTGGHVPQTNFQQASKKPVETMEQTKVSEPAFQANTAAIDRAQAEMKSLPDVDMEKVEQVRNALARGELSLDTKALSKAIMQFHTGHE